MAFPLGACYYCSLRTPLVSPSASSSPWLLRTALPSLKSSRAQIRVFSLLASSPMDQRDRGRRSLMEFPYLSDPHRNLMVDLLSTIENRLGSQLLPCTLPPDVQYLENQTGTAHAAIQMKPGRPSSSIDIILGSWIHCDLPTGGALNITSLSTCLNSSTDAPNLLMELIQSSPTSVVFILDLTPRKDLVLHQDYLQTFYQDTQLDSFRQRLADLPEVRPYFSSSLFVRCACSPTAIMIRVDTQEGGAKRLEEIVKDHLDPVAKEVLGIWVNECACVERSVGETEKAELEKRDRLFRSKTLEVDLASSFPRLFGPEIASRAIEAMKEAFSV